MAVTKSVRLQDQNEPPDSSQVLEWEKCLPGVLKLSSLAVGTMAAAQREIKGENAPERRVETEADIVDGDAPLFV